MCGAKKRSRSEGDLSQTRPDEHLVARTVDEPSLKRIKLEEGGESSHPLFSQYSNMQELVGKKKGPFHSQEMCTRPWTFTGEMMKNYEDFSSISNDFDYDVLKQREISGVKSPLIEELWGKSAWRKPNVEIVRRQQPLQSSLIMENITDELVQMFLGGDVIKSKEADVTSRTSRTAVSYSDAFECFPSDKSGSFSEDFSCELMCQTALITQQLELTTPTMKTDILFDRRVITNPGITNYEISESFSVVCYNTRAEIEEPEEALFPEGRCVNGFLMLENYYRKLNQELLKLTSDVYCLQSVSDWYFKRLKDVMSQHGFEGCRMSRLPNPNFTNEVIFFRTRRFELIEERGWLFQDLLMRLFIQTHSNDAHPFCEQVASGEVVQAVTLKCKITGKQLLVVNTRTIRHYQMKPHLHLLQVLSVAKGISCAQEADENLAVIFCGDINCEPSSSAYQSIVNLEPSQRNVMKSAYKEVLGYDVKTTWNRSMEEIMFGSYVLYDPNQLRCINILEVVPSRMFMNEGLPSQTFPSGNLSLQATFSFTKGLKAELQETRNAVRETSASQQQSSNRVDGSEMSRQTDQASDKISCRVPAEKSVGVNCMQYDDPSLQDDCHVTSDMQVSDEEQDSEDLFLRADKLVEGKTKVIVALKNDPGLVLIESKDRITAGDGTRAHDLEGKAAIYASITSDIFKMLNNAGVKTHFVHQQSEKEFIARRCDMIPIEFVTRRIATGSFLRRNPGVAEGFRFCPPKLEFFFKDDASHDPQWSYEQIVAAKMNCGGVVIGADELDIICKTTVCVFEILERAWASVDCALIDMKIEFGVDVEKKEILLANIIDSDSWRLWPSGDHRLIKDKQMDEVTPESSEVVKDFAWISKKVKQLAEQTPSGRVAVLIGSLSDIEFGKKIQDKCLAFSLPSELRVSSVLNIPGATLKIQSEYEANGIPTVFIAVADLSNGLGPVLSSSSTWPVINCPPLTGLRCSTGLSPEAAALQAAQIFALSDHVIWSRLRASQLNTWIGLQHDDALVRKQ